MKLFLITCSFLFVFSCSKKEEPKEEASVFNSHEAKKVVGNQSLPGYAIINSSDCASCHIDSEKLVGPSYQEIAKKYSEKETDYLAQKIIEGGRGVWGQVPMVPHSQISKEEAKHIVAYILSVH